MQRILPGLLVLIHWNEAEAGPRLERLRKLGFDAEWIAARGGAGLNAYYENPPRAFLIDLTRMPSHGRAIAVLLRQRKATRAVPIVFMGGEPEKIEKARQALPGAAFVSWEVSDAELRSAITGAKVNAAARAPGTMAEYSGVPLAKKLGIGDETAVASLGAPEELLARLGIAGDAVRAERALFFARSDDDLTNGFDAAARRVRRGGGLWIFWPKKSSRVRSDLTLERIRAFANECGWGDYKICSLDETWSGMLFSRRAK